MLCACEGAHSSDTDEMGLQDGAGESVDGEGVLLVGCEGVLLVGGEDVLVEHHPNDNLVVCVVLCVCVCVCASTRVCM